MPTRTLVMSFDTLIAHMGLGTFGLPRGSVGELVAINERFLILASFRTFAVAVIIDASLAQARSFTCRRNEAARPKMTEAIIAKLFGSGTAVTVTGLPATLS